MIRQKPIMSRSIVDCSTKIKRNKSNVNINKYIEEPWLLIESILKINIYNVLYDIKSNHTMILY